MNQIYQITGTTCENCEKSFEEGISGVIPISVDLEKGTFEGRKEPPIPSFAFLDNGTRILMGLIMLTKEGPL